MINGQNVFIHSERIYRKGQYKRFQIRLPEDVEQITGFELGYRFEVSMHNIERLYILRYIYMFLYWESSFDFWHYIYNTFIEFRTLIMGKLLLQSTNSNNVSYSAEIPFEDIKFGSFDPSAQFFDGNYYYTHKLKSGIDCVKIKGETTILEGVYNDEFSKLIDEDLVYHVLIYVWYKPKQLKP